MKGLIEFTERFGNLLSRTLLTLLYFFVLGPFALVYQLVADPLRLRQKHQGRWVEWDRPDASLSTARKQD